MLAIIFDMYGVIMKDPYGNLMPFVQQHFPDRTLREVYDLWGALEGGRIGPEDFWRGIGFGEDWERVEREYLLSIDAHEDFFGAAKQLRETYRLALLSNDVSSWSERLRERHALNGYFDAVIVSGDVGVSKPDAAIYRHALERLGLAARECLFIDDCAANLRAARSVGLHTIHFNSRGEEPYGCVVNDYPELLRAIREKERNT